MAKRTKRKEEAQKQKLKKGILIVSGVILVVKLVLIFSIQNGAWLGADTESYLKGVDALIKDGFYSKEFVLIYWPAGYPIFIWVLSMLSMSKVIYLVAVFQTLAYFAATVFFVGQVRRTRLSKFAMPLALILGLNPTLSLSSLVIGYESIVASCLLFSVALIIRYQQNPNKNKRNLIQTIFIVGMIQGFSAFVQPRGILLGIAIFAIWGVFNGGWRSILTCVVLGTCVLMILPAALIFRNVQANNVATISTNLGITMDIGAGDNATGAYSDGITSKYGVPCRPTPPATTVSDSQRVKCVISWYMGHPRKSAILAVKKSIYFWSPWYGPLANGTMARNPWLKMDPIKSIASTRAGHSLVFGWFGKAISWIWMLSGLLLLFAGFRWLWRLGGLEKEIGLLAGVPVLLAWLTSIGTIGDHRFRLPTMGLSLFLQVVGYFALKDRFPWGQDRATLEPRGQAR